jgi:hypothetical protein
MSRTILLPRLSGTLPTPSARPLRGPRRRSRDPGAVRSTAQPAGLAPHTRASHSESGQCLRPREWYRRLARRDQRGGLSTCGPAVLLAGGDPLGSLCRATQVVKRWRVGQERRRALRVDERQRQLALRVDRDDEPAIFGCWRGDTNPKYTRRLGDVVGRSVMLPRMGTPYGIRSRVATLARGWELRSKALSRADDWQTDWPASGWAGVSPVLA